jgi:hypothetical protein
LCLKSPACGAIGRVERSYGLRIAYLRDHEKRRCRQKHNRRPNFPTGCLVW